MVAVSVALRLLYRFCAPDSMFMSTNKLTLCAKLAREFRLVQMRRGYCTVWALPTNWRYSAYGQVHIIKGVGRRSHAAKDATRRYSHQGIRVSALSVSSRRCPVDAHCCFSSRAATYRASFNRLY